jgi:hypothetical protein
LVQFLGFGSDGRRYSYHVCRTARRKGWAACPVKTIPAARIEELVIDQLRSGLLNEGTLIELRVSPKEYLMLESRHAARLISEFVEKVIAGHSGRVMLELQRRNP